jgi:hypothetical protein
VAFILFFVSQKERRFLIGLTNKPLPFFSKIELFCKKAKRALLQA